MRTTPIVLVHGARTSHTMWRRQLEAFDPVGRPAVAIDLPGHGTRIAERFSVPASVDVIAEAIDALGGRAVVVGESLGGYLGIAHAVRHPDQVAGLVAASCCSVPDQPATSAWLLAVRGIARLPDKGAWLNQRLVNGTMPREAGLDVAEGGLCAGRHGGHADRHPAGGPAGRPGAHPVPGVAGQRSVGPLPAA